MHNCKKLTALHTCPVMADDNSNDAKYVCGCDMEEKDPVLCDFIGILDVDTTESVQEN